MASKKNAQTEDQFTISEIAKIVGNKAPILPGESIEDYEAGLMSTINELEAKTHLQIYLAQKIFDCIWWIRRLELQKRTLVIGEMCSQLSIDNGIRAKLRVVFNSGDLENPNLQRLLNEKSLTLEELVSKGMRYERNDIEKLDQQIADRIKAMRDLQTSYEALVNRKSVAERLRMQNQLMQQSLNPPSVASLISKD